jgi:Tfp pilus assembly protein PilF
MAVNGGKQATVIGAQISGGAAIVAPASAFPSGVPPTAMVVIPIGKPTAELMATLAAGPAPVTPDEMWKLLGFRGPAVQVQDDQGRPVAVGLEDLLAGLDKHWTAQPDELGRGRVYAQQLLKHGRLARAEEVLSDMVQRGGSGEDRLALGIAQLAQDKLDLAEDNLQAAQNMLKSSPFPSLHLAKVYQKRKEEGKERESVERALHIDPASVDAWAFLFQLVRRREGEAQALLEIETRAAQQRTAAPFIAVQGIFAGSEATRDRAAVYARKAVEKAPNDPLTLLCLSALHGQKRDYESVVRLLQPHEAKMTSHVGLANNYYEALFQLRKIDEVTKLLNTLVASPSEEVKQFAIARARIVAQYLQKQQEQLATQGKWGGTPRKG